MSKTVNIGFEPERLDILIKDILPTKTIAESIKKTKKYKQVEVSVHDIGLVEPLIVYPAKKPKGKFQLLDGHIRLEVLKEMEAEQAPCLISKDDEAFTYNKRINRLATVQEHYMILKAIDKGVPPDRIASALGVNVARIQQKSKLLDGICPEVVEILKDRHFAVGLTTILKRMKPLRQIEAVEFMVASNNFSVSYAKAMLMATPDEQLCKPDTKKPVKGLTEKQRSRMEREMKKLQRDMKAVEEDYGTNVVRLVVSNGYVSRLLDSDPIAHYLERHHGELLTQLQNLTRTLAREAGESEGIQRIENTE